MRGVGTCSSEKRTDGLTATTRLAISSLDKRPSSFLSNWLKMAFTFSARPVIGSRLATRSSMSADDELLERDLSVTCPLDFDMAAESL